MAIFEIPIINHVKFTIVVILPGNLFNGSGPQKAIAFLPKLDLVLGPTIASVTVALVAYVILQL